MLDLDKTDLKDNVLIITNDDGSIQCIPRDGATDDELALFNEFETAFPDGKPEPEVNQSAVIPSIEDRISALENVVLNLI